MRLVEIHNDGALSLTKDLIGHVPNYAILSHTWEADEDEVTFNDFESESSKSKTGYKKIRFCREQTQKDHLQHFWLDTCCIDKSNHSELAEAITSMFDWYTNAAKCYVFLADVSARKRDNEGNQEVWRSALRTSRYFTRRWTLQEILAPASVEFFSKEGEHLGDKSTLEQLLSEITTIPRDALSGTPLSRFSIEERLQWADKRNAKRTEDRVYSLVGIFDVSMVINYGEGEEKAFRRLTDEIGKAHAKQLENLGRTYAAPNSRGHELRTTRPSPSRSTNMSLHDHRKTMLTSLCFAQMDSRQDTIRTAYSTTCQWLLEHPAYLDWTDPEHMAQYCGSLWINGKPGAGKSTLIKFTLGRAARESSEHEIVLSFFFNARGGELERSTLGMYRSLLFQLLRKATDLQHLLDDLDTASGEGIESSAWTTARLCKLLSAAIMKLGEQRRLKCFIDAVDECDDEEVRDMVVFIEELKQVAMRSGTQLYTCFASRHYPTIDIHNGRKMILEDEEGHGDDLAKYIRSHLRAGKGNYIQEVRAQIQEMANGVFMWAVLVVDILNKEFLRGRIFAVKQRLKDIPRELSDLLKDILLRDNVNITDLILCLQWMLFAKQPLRREEFYFAMVAGLDAGFDNLTSWDPEQITVDDMSRFVLNSSKGLAELTKSKSPTVQFIHESVRDFLILEDGLHQIWPDIGEDLYSLCHDQLKRCCRNYLHADLSEYLPADGTNPKASSDAAKDLRDLLAIKYPFLEYASRHLLYHANEAATGIPQDDFLRDFPLDRWLLIANLLERYDVRRHTPEASLLYILAENDCARLIQTVCRHDTMINIQGERYRYPFLAATVKGHRDAAQALLQPDSEAAKGRVAVELERGPSVALKDHTPLLWAVANRHVTIVKLLLERGASIEDRDNEDRTALTIAASNGDEEGLSLVLGKGANIEERDKAGTTALMAAASNGHRESFLFLLEKGANIDAQNGMGATALLLAIKKHENAIVQLLLDKGVNIEAKDHEDSTAFITAINGRNDVVAQLLLDRGVELEQQDIYGCTALMKVVSQQRTSMVQQLLIKGANPESKHSNGDSVLMMAVQRGNEAIVELLLDSGATFRAMSSDDIRVFSTAVLGKNEAILQLLVKKSAKSEQDLVRATLMCAVVQGSEEIVRLLINREIDIEARFPDGKTALTLAAAQGQAVVIQVILDMGADLNAPDWMGRTALMWAAGNGHLTIVKQLLDRGANTGAQYYTGRALNDPFHGTWTAITQDNNGTTALILAAIYGYEMNVQLLLMAGANTEAHDQAGRTALIWAAVCGHETIVQKLLDSGADMQAQYREGTTALMFAAMNGNETIVRHLLQGDATPDVHDNQGRTALIWAAMNGHERIVQHLLWKGADPCVSDNQGRTALMLAKVEGFEVVVQLLQTHAASIESLTVGTYF